MPVLCLHHLDQRSVAVEIPIASQSRVVKGHGRFVTDEPSGAAALYVTVQGLAEEFELIFDARQFSGSIEHGERFACDYAIRLESGMPQVAAA